MSKRVFVLAVLALPGALAAAVVFVLACAAVQSQ